MPWLAVILLLVLSAGLSALGAPATIGRHFWLIAGSIALMGLCFRIVEWLFWLRFPARNAPSTTARTTGVVLAVLTPVHGVLLVAGV